MPILALTFDVFGTLTDPRGSIAAEGRRLVPDREVDWAGLADAWADAYGDYLEARRGWLNLDLMLASAFHRLAPRFGLSGLPLPVELELSTAWSRLRAWPDALEGLRALEGSTRLAALTNANAAMLESLRASSGLPFDALLSAERVQAYKPDPKVYRMACDALGLRPEEICMVASHAFDLDAAKRQGLMTALIVREHGSRPSELKHEADFVVGSAVELAEAVRPRIGLDPDPAAVRDEFNRLKVHDVDSWRVEWRPFGNWRLRAAGAAWTVVLDDAMRVLEAWKARGAAS